MANATAPAELELVQQEIFEGFPDLVRALGGDPARLLAAAGIAAPAADAAIVATYRQLVALLEGAAQALHCPDFGMRLAQRQQGSRIYGPLGDVMRNSSTFREAVAYAASHTYAHSLSARIWSRPVVGEPMVICGHDILLEDVIDTAQTTEQILLVGNLGARQLTGGRARARRVHFRHPPIAPVGTYRRHFGCDVLFGQDDNGLLFSEEDMRSPIVGPDAQSYDLATAYVESRFPHRVAPMRLQVRGIIMQRLGGDLCDRERVAAELGLHSRTLRRRLAEEDTTFQAIKDAVRRDLLLYYATKTNLSFSHVAERLGLSEQAVMTRLSNRWFGCPPNRLRAQR